MTIQPCLVFSQVAVNPLSNLNQAGVVAAFKGIVKIDSQKAVGQEAKTGMPIYLGDKISTGEKGNLQILLLDQTVFTIGPSSAMVIDEFVYDPATQSGKVKAKIVEGVFRFVTGKIGHKNPRDMQVDLPNGTIGIRGTIVGGQTGGGNSLVVLFGPGSQNNASARQGSFVLSNNSGGGSQSTEVTRSGFGSTIEGNNPPSPSFEVPQEQLNQLSQSLSPQSDADDSQNSDTDSDGEDSSATESAGQDDAESGEFAVDQQSTGDEVGDLDSLLGKAAQEDSDSEFDFFDGFTTKDQLELAAKSVGGIHHFKAENVDVTNAGGEANFYINIDFGARTIGGPNSKVTGSLTGSTDTFEFPISVVGFGSGPDPATYFFDSVANTDMMGSTCKTGNCEIADISLSILNAGGEIASHAAVAIDIQDASGNTHSKGSDIADRVSGSSPP